MSELVEEPPEPADPPAPAVPAPAPPRASPAWLGRAGFVMACVLSLIKAGEVLIARRRRARHPPRSPHAEVEGAWFKTLVLDGVIPDLRRFLDSQQAALKDAASALPGMPRPYLATLKRYAPAAENLKIRLQPLEDLSPHAHATVIRALEDLEDRVAPFCPHADDRSYNPDLLEVESSGVQVQFGLCLRDCLVALREAHHEVAGGA